MFILFIFLSLSCSSYGPPPPNIHIAKSQLSNHKKVALTVTSSELDVKYSRADFSLLSPLAAMFGVLPFLAVLGIEEASDSKKDHSRAIIIQESTTKQYLEKLLGDNFIERIRTTNPFYIGSRHHDRPQTLITEGFDALIELRVEDLCLKRKSYSEVLEVYLLVTGKMISLHDNKIIWSQREEDLSDEVHTYDAYKDDNASILKGILEKMFHKIAVRMANDIIFSK